MFKAGDLKNTFEKIIPFHQVLGFQLQEIEEGFVRIRIPYKKELVGDPRTNRIHGGVISTAMDAAGGAAGMTTLSESTDQIATVDIHVDYLYPGKPEDILVEARIVRNGNSLIFTQMTARHEGDDQIIAQARAVYRVKRTGHE